MWYWHDSTCTHTIHMCAEFQGCCLYPHMAKWTRVSLVTGIVSLSLWFRVLLGGAWSREPWRSPMEMSVSQGRSPPSRTTLPMGGGMGNHALTYWKSCFSLREPLAPQLPDQSHTLSRAGFTHSFGNGNTPFCVAGSSAIHTRILFVIVSFSWRICLIKKNIPGHLRDSI